LKAVRTDLSGSISRAAAKAEIGRMNADLQR